VSDPARALARARSDKSRAFQYEVGAEDARDAETVDADRGCGQADERPPIVPRELCGPQQVVLPCRQG